MSDYKGVVGTAVVNVAGDPPAPLEGELWYNSSTDSFKIYKTSTFLSWATGNNMNTARESLTGAGTQTSGLAFGGITNPNTRHVATEYYNGTNWTELNNLNAARSGLGGCGASHTAALAFGGFSNPPVTRHVSTETWNGTNWTEVADLNTGGHRLSGAGANNTAALAFGGTSRTASTEQWSETGGIKTITS